jgi:hypothetical protein
VIFCFDTNSPSQVEDAVRFYRNGVHFNKWFLHFLARARKRKQKKTPVSRAHCASSNRPMIRRLVPPCGVVTLARVLTIWRLLRASLHLTPCLAARCLRHCPVEAAGARGNSPRFQRDSNSPRALIRPPRRCSARDKGKSENQRQKHLFEASFEQATGLPRAAV